MRKDDKEWADNIWEYRYKVVDAVIADGMMPTLARCVDKIKTMSDGWWFRIAYEQMAWDMVWEKFAWERVENEEKIRQTDSEIWIAKREEIKLEGRRLIKMEEDRFDKLWKQWRDGKSVQDGWNEWYHRAEIAYADKFQDDSLMDWAAIDTIEKARQRAWEKMMTEDMEAYEGIPILE
jgi:hypothetical protein